MLRSFEWRWYCENKEFWKILERNKENLVIHPKLNHSAAFKLGHYLINWNKKINEHLLKNCRCEIWVLKLVEEQMKNLKRTLSFQDEWKQLKYFLLDRSVSKSAVIAFLNTYWVQLKIFGSLSLLTYPSHPYTKL